MQQDTHQFNRERLPSGADADDVAQLGRRLTWDGERLFGLSAELRGQHTFIVRQTGTGKSTLLRDLLVQIIHVGGGVGLIDPHGDLAAELLDHIPPNRTDDVIFFNPSDLEHPVGLNLLADVAVADRHRAASGIVGAFKSVWHEPWGHAWNTF